MITLDKEELRQLGEEFSHIDVAGFLGELAEWQREVCDGEEPDCVKELTVSILDTVEDVLGTYLTAEPGR